MTTSPIIHIITIRINIYPFENNTLKHFTKKKYILGEILYNHWKSSLLTTGSMIRRMDSRIADHIISFIRKEKKVLRNN